MFTEKTIEKQTHFEGHVFNIERHKVSLPDGHQAYREIVRHNGGACVVALDQDLQVWLVTQFRKPFDQELLEIPAGKLEKGEDPLHCAKRELTEETGLRARHFEWLATVLPSPGYCDEKLTIYLALGLTPGEAHLDEGEFLTCRKMPLQEALEMIDDGRLTDAKSQVGLMRAARWLQQQGGPVWDAREEAVAGE